MPAKAEPSGEKSYTRSIIRCCEEPQEEDGDNGGTSGEESHQLHQMHLSPNGEEGNAAVREAQQQPQHATAVIPEISGQEGVAQRPSAGNNNAAADGDDQYTEPTASVVSTSGYNTNTSSAASNHHSEQNSETSIFNDDYSWLVSKEQMNSSLIYMPLVLAFPCEDSLIQVIYEHDDVHPDVNEFSQAVAQKNGLPSKKSKLRVVLADVDKLQKSPRPGVVVADDDKRQKSRRPSVVLADDDKQLKARRPSWISTLFARRQSKPSSNPARKHVYVKVEV